MGHDLNLKLVGVLKSMENLAEVYDLKDVGPVESLEFKLIEYLHQSNALHLIASKELGGLEFKVRELIQIFRSHGHHHRLFCFNLIANLLGYSAVKEFGSPELVKSVTSAMYEEPSLWSFAMTENEIGSDIKSIKSTAHQTATGYLLIGEKNYITNAGNARFASVFAQTVDQRERPLGISCFMVDLNSRGVVRGSRINKSCGIHSNTGHLAFQSVTIPSSHLIGAVGQGLEILKKCISRSKILLAATAVSLAERAQSITRSFLLEQIRYGKPIFEQKHIQHLFARMHVETLAGWSLTRLAAETWDYSLDASIEASSAKHFCGKMAANISSQCTEFFGARGVLAESEIGRLFHDTKAIEIVEGTSAIQELIIMSGLFSRMGQAETKIDSQVA